MFSDCGEVLCLNEGVYNEGDLEVGMVWGVLFVKNSEFGGGV